MLNYSENKITNCLLTIIYSYKQKFFYQTGYILSFFKNSEFNYKIKKGAFKKNKTLPTRKGILGQF